NMSDHEAMTFVNYFAAIDRRENPAVNLTYPYEAVPQRSDDYLAKEGEQYLERLGPPALQQRAEREKLQTLVWDRMLQDRITEAEGDVKAAEAAMKTAKGDEQKSAQARRDQLQARLKTLTDEASQKEGPYRRELRQEWEKHMAYATDAYRLLANNELCLKCHQVGAYEPNQPIGPNLDQVADRLRPNWTERWIASPQRMMVYPEGSHPMPQSFLSNKSEYQEIFAGAARQQVTALRDILMNYLKVAALPENRWYRPTSEAPK